MPGNARLVGLGQQLRRSTPDAARSAGPTRPRLTTGAQARRGSRPDSRKAGRRRRSRAASAGCAAACAADCSRIEVEEFHAGTGSLQLRPCRDNTVRVARAEACGSCVTMTIVLPCSRLSELQQAEHLVGGCAVEVAGGLVAEQQRAGRRRSHGRWRRAAAGRRRARAG